MPVRAVLFDLGNTLWHIPEPPPQDAVRQETVRRILALIKSWGIEPSEKNRVMGRDIRLAITAADRAAYDTDCVSPDFHQIVHDVAADHGLEITREQAEELWETWNLGGAFFGRRLFDDALPTLDALRSRGYKTGCVTNRAFSGKGFLSELEELGLAGQFEVMSVSCDVGYMKPHRKIFEHALEDLGIAPGQAVMVGDSLRADVKGAEDVGMIGVHRRYARSPEKVDGIVPDFAVDELQELLALACFDEQMAAPKRTRKRASKAPAKAWGSRFSGGTHPLAEQYTLSLPVDRRLWREEIAASIAHARMLGKQRIIPRAEARAIVRGLEQVGREIEDGKFPWRDDLEDVHTNVEARLREKIGDAAGRLHTARSRNDQVATDLRLYARNACDRSIDAARSLQRSLVALADASRRVVMPGYTHLQRAQPVLLAHHLLAYVEQLERDVDRFDAAKRRADVLPLGSGALAGVPYPLDREAVARELGFSRISDNSLDAVSDRDFAVEFVAAAALCMTHVSRLAEEIVLWSSAEFSFVRLPDAFATGSSIMPQKRNPDVAELARARTGRAYGALTSLLTTLKALPLAYNRDLQEDKRAFFEAEDVLLETLEVFAAMLPELRFDAALMRRAATANYALATDLADYLVRKGLPFRQAHNAVGQLVRYAEQQNKTFARLTLGEYRQFSPLFAADVLELDLAAALAARDLPGGTAPRRVATALRRWKKKLG